MGGSPTMAQLAVQFAWTLALASFFMALCVRPHVCFCAGLPPVICAALARQQRKSLRAWLRSLRSPPVTLEHFAAAAVQACWRGVKSRMHSREGS